MTRPSGRDIEPEHGTEILKHSYPGKQTSDVQDLVRSCCDFKLSIVCRSNVAEVQRADFRLRLRAEQRFRAGSGMAMGFTDGPFSSGHCFDAKQQPGGD